VTDPYEAHTGSIPRAYRDVFEKESFAHLATVDAEGAPHNTPLWVDHEDGEYVLLNTLRGRQKERNLRGDPRAAVSVTDPENPYRYVSVRGRATLTEDGADEVIDRLAGQYLDADTYPHHDEEEAPRVTVRIPAEHVVVRGRDADR
jgi:PPOX class probable F420-dependent enzyme